jgi:competence protein ComEA
VPVKGAGPAASPTGSGPVHVNTATVDELQTLPGVGPEMAQRIIDYREANGPFTDIESLDAVPGIGPSMLEKLQGLVAFD